MEGATEALPEDAPREERPEDGTMDGRPDDLFGLAYTEIYTIMIITNAI